MSEEIRGIDVSHWQGEINWSEVAKSDIAFAMIKANQRENARLSDLRDSLLPRLMSGEIDVSAIDI